MRDLLTGAEIERPMHPRLARIYASMAADVIGQFHGLAIEHGWVVNRDFSEAKYVGCGRYDQIFLVPNDAIAGDTLLHSHPSDGPPSERDLELAVEYAQRGVGSGILSRDLRQLTMIREPEEPSRYHANVLWRVRRLTLFAGWRKQ